jgi:hypothetical protein
MIDPSLVNLPAALHYKGAWDATQLPPTGVVAGDLYIVLASGTVDASWGSPAAGQTCKPGDWLVYNNAGQWQLIPIVTTGTVTEAPTDGAFYARQNAVWANVKNGFVSKAGDTMTGALGVGITNPVAFLHVKGRDSDINFGVSGDTLGIRISCRPTEAALEAVDTTLVGSYQNLTLGGAYVMIKEGAALRAQFGGGINQFYGSTYCQGEIYQFLDSGEFRQMAADGLHGFRFINTSAGGALGRSVWQASQDGFGSIYGTGFTYDPAQQCIRPEADSTLDVGNPTYRFRNASFGGNIVTAASVIAGSGGTLGQVRLQQGNSSSVTGYIGFYDTGGTLQGYIGDYGAGQPISYVNSNGSGHSFQGGNANFTGAVAASGTFITTGASGGYQVNPRDGSGPPYLFYAAGGYGSIYATDTGRVCRMDNQGRWLPGADGVSELGTTGQRWLSVWSVNSVLQTSDAREKRWRGGLNDNELAASKALPREIGIYQWLRDLETDGENAKLQCGLLAQTVIEVFSANGLDALDYGFVRYDEWPEREDSNADGEVIIHPGGNRYSIMFPDLLAFMMVGQEQRLAALEARL